MNSMKKSWNEAKWWTAIVEAKRKFTIQECSYLRERERELNTHTHRQAVFLSSNHCKMDLGSTIQAYSFIHKQFCTLCHLQQTLQHNRPLFFWKFYWISSSWLNLPAHLAHIQTQLCMHSRLPWVQCEQKIQNCNLFKSSLAYVSIFHSASSKRHFKNFSIGIMEA